MFDSLNSPLLVVGFIGVLLLIMAAIYYFHKSSTKDSNTGVRKWINHSNYNIAASEEELRAIEQADKQEALKIIERLKESQEHPVSEEVFYALKKKTK